MQTECREFVFDASPRASRQTLRVLELMLVLAVAFGRSLLVSAFVVFGYPLHGDYSSSPAVFVAIATELVGLSVLGYISLRQGRDWRTLLGQWELKDIAVALGLLISYALAATLLNFILQRLAYSFTGHFIQPVDVKKMLAITPSVFSVMFILINPLFEELIVRAYLISEVIDMTNNRVLAVVLSTAIQTGYHLYQGGLNAALLASGFLIMSIYYAKTRRIAPVILTHFALDAMALLSTR